MRIKKKIIYQIKRLIPHYLYPMIIQHGYKKIFSRLCDFEHPKTYNEKIQWSKFHRKAQIITECADKIKVRDFVKERIGEEYLIPMIGGPYKKAKEINFDSLPNSFVIKANHGCGFNLLVRDKNKLNLKKTIVTLDSWLKYSFAYEAFEFHYKDILPMLYIEQNLLTEQMKDLPDYKFFCFNGKVFCSYTMTNYVLEHSNGELAFFDRDYNIMPYHRVGYKAVIQQPNKPKNYDRMVEIAEKLSEGFSHVRVDLYNVEGKIFFGEMTFTTCGGYGRFVPDEFDEILGAQWKLDSGI
jgi:hypothetical protein